MKVYNIGHLAKAFELELQIERDNISIYFKEFRDQHFKAKVERLVVKISGSLLVYSVKHIRVKHFYPFLQTIKIISFS